MSGDEELPDWLDHSADQEIKKGDTGLFEKVEKGVNTRRVDIGEVGKAAGDDTQSVEIARQEALRIQAGIKKQDEDITKLPPGPPWKVLLAGDERTVEDIACNAHLDESGAYIQQCKILPGMDGPELRKQLAYVGAAAVKYPYHAVLFCIDDLAPARKFCAMGHNLLQGYLTPVITVGNVSLDGILSIGYPNLHRVQTADAAGRPRPGSEIGADIDEKIRDAVDFVNSIKVPGVIVMSNSPEPYLALKARGIDVYAVEPSKGGFAEAWVCLNGKRDRNNVWEAKPRRIGAVVIDCFSEYPALLAHTVHNDSVHNTIKRVCVGADMNNPAVRDYALLPLNSPAAAVEKLPKILWEANFAKPLEICESSADISLDSPERMIGRSGGLIKGFDEK